MTVKSELQIAKKTLGKNADLPLAITYSLYPNFKDFNFLLPSVRTQDGGKHP
jgi:hypothetical protein